VIISNFASVKLVMQLDKDFPEPEMHSMKTRTNTALKEIAIKHKLFVSEAVQNFSETIPAFKLIGIIGESGH
jgi:ABC-type bacteriocin/lantibiotic exporter with double-glycine peptidase domain